MCLGLKILKDFVKAANNLAYGECLSEVGSFYKDDFKLPELSTQLKILGTYFSEQNNTSVTLQDCLQYLQSLSSAQRSVFYSKVCVLVNPLTRKFQNNSHYCDLHEKRIIFFKLYYM